MSSTNVERQPIVVRNLRPDDIEAVIAIDQHATGRRREEYFRKKLGAALTDTGIQVSLAAELDGSLVGFLLARVFYGEYGAVEQAATLDTIGVRPDDRGQGVAHALLEQLRTNLLGVGIHRLQTQVDWDDQALLSFFHHEGFRPAQRLCLDLDVDYR
jgi:ribosomal protein S18 acetylase RimI-like enzyme